MFFFLNTDDAYLLSSWSGSFSPVLRRQKRPCYGHVYMVIVTHKHDYVYVKGIFGKLTTDNYINTLCSSFFPWNLVCAISVPNGVASGIKSSKLCLQFFLNVKFKAKDSKTKNYQDPNCWPVWVPSVWPPPSHPLWCRWSPRLLWAGVNVTVNKNLTEIIFWWHQRQNKFWWWIPRVINVEAPP